jgi:hypothetical protein
MLAFGIGGLAAGSVLLYFDFRVRKKAATRVSMTPLLGGAGLSLGGQF